MAALQSEDLKPLKREHFTVGLVLELWKKMTVKQMQRWISALTPVELQKYQSGLTSQNLKKACNDLLKKSQKLGKNKKKEELELLKQSLFYLPGSNTLMAREQLTPKSKAIAELRDENRGLKRSVRKILSFNERLMDEQDALITDQAALEEEYFSTVEHMRMLTNNARRKVMITKSKAMLPQFQDNPLLLVEKRVMHNCIEDGSEQAEWFNATVLHLAEDIPDGANAIDAEYIIRYDIDEDEDEWTNMPLLKDLKKGDLIVL